MGVNVIAVGGVFAEMAVRVETTVKVAVEVEAARSGVAVGSGMVEFPANAITISKSDAEFSY